MSTPTPSPLASRRAGIMRLVVAACINLLILAITIPSLGSVPLPGHKIGYGWRDAAAVAGMVAPLIVILIGAAWSRVVEYIGWALLLILLIMLFMS